MDTSNLYLELLECGDCVIQAVAAERQAKNAMRRHSCRALERSCAARRELERAAEYYVMALRRFRVAVVSEFLPTAAQARPNCRRAGRFKDREKSRAALTSPAFAPRGISKFN